MKKISLDEGFIPLKMVVVGQVAYMHKGCMEFSQVKHGLGLEEPLPHPPTPSLSSTGKVTQPMNMQRDSNAV